MEEKKKYLTVGEIYRLALSGDIEKEQDLYNLVKGITKDYLDQFTIPEEEKETTILGMIEQTKLLLQQARANKETTEDFDWFMEIISNTLESQLANKKRKR